MGFLIHLYVNVYGTFTGYWQATTKGLVGNKYIHFLCLTRLSLTISFQEWIEKYVGSCADLHALVANYTVSDNHSGSNFRSYHVSSISLLSFV